jgi:NAD(P)H dehydrogenase (quinone)
VKILIVHAHPEPKSFNGALTRTAVEFFMETGHEVQVSDLYQMHFNPVSDRRNFVTVKDADYYKQQIEEMHATEVNGFAADIQAELDKLDWCDILILQFPLWWFGMPAILKGWVDRVFAMGRIYGAGKWYDNGYFRGKKAFCSVTIGGPEEMYTEDGINGNIHELLFPINHGVFFFVGFEVLPPYLVHAPARMSHDQRVEALKLYAEKLSRLETELPIKYKTLAEASTSASKK